MRILLTNDDGVEAVGLRCLAEALGARHELLIVAPGHEQSGIGHAFTFKTPLYYRQTRAGGGPPTYAVDGTPADCVKFAVAFLAKPRPDVVVAGMNIGENSGISSIYSGTVAAAREGALWGIPSFAFSVAGTIERYAADYAVRAAGILEWVMGFAEGELVRRHPRTFYNVNFPACAPSECRGVRVTRQSLAFFDDHYRSAGRTEHGEGYQLYGEKRNLEAGLEYDSRALADHYAALTPLELDATDADTFTALGAEAAPSMSA